MTTDDGARFDFEAATRRPVHLPVLALVIPTAVVNGAATGAPLLRFLVADGARVDGCCCRLHGWFTGLNATVLADATTNDLSTETINPFFHNYMRPFMNHNKPVDICCQLPNELPMCGYKGDLVADPPNKLIYIEIADTFVSVLEHVCPSLMLYYPDSDTCLAIGCLIGRCLQLSFRAGKLKAGDQGASLGWWEGGQAIYRNGGQVGGRTEMFY